MSEKRRDKKGRVLRSGECQRKDGMYQYDYVGIDGVPKCVYSWKLEPTDPLPKGKRQCLSLREKEKDIQKLIDARIIPDGGHYTVIQLATEHVSKIKLKISTRQAYQYKLNSIGREDFANTRIDRVRTSDIKQWYKRMKERGVSYGTICGTHRLLRCAFQSAVEDDLLVRNPFDFRLNKVIENDTKSKEAVEPEFQRKFLNFVKNNKCYCKHYNVLCILLLTGIRISELCGLTFDDIDLERNEIHITKQMQRITGRGNIITSPKSNNGIRILPITDEAKNCFKSEILKRAKLKREPVVFDEAGNEYQGFIFLSTRGNPKTAANFDSTFRNIVAQYNKAHPGENFKITPHICRHTYSTNYAGQTEKMNPKHLQYLMGHARVETTLNIYTHVNKSNIRRDIECVDISI